MIIYRLPDGGLLIYSALIHSAIALDEAAMIELESLGKPRIMIVPNCTHRLDADVYKQRYLKL